MNKINCILSAHRNFGSGKRAFTMIEMVLVITLMSAMGLALYRSLADGIKIWRQSREATTEEDVALFLDHISQDLRNAVIYGPIDFEKGAARFAFPAVIRVRQDHLRSAGRTIYTQQIGKVEYYFDKRDKAIFRRQANYSQALDNKYQAPRQMTGSIQSARFDYAYATEVGPEAPQGEGGFMPAAVLIELEVRESQGQIRHVKRLINIPVATIL